MKWFSWLHDLAGRSPVFER